MTPDDLAKHGLRVKPCEGPNFDWDYFGWKHVSRGDWDDSDEEYKTPHLAKVAAQADHAARVCATLELIAPLDDAALEPITPPTAMPISIHHQSDEVVQVGPITPKQLADILREKFGVDPKTGRLNHGNTESPYNTAPPDVAQAARVLLDALTPKDLAAISDAIISARDYQFQNPDDNDACACVGPAPLTFKAFAGNTVVGPQRCFCVQRGIRSELEAALRALLPEGGE